MPVIVAPFHGRIDISGLVLAQWAKLRDDGFIYDAVVVACDENIDLAEDHGFTTAEVPNDVMGARWNAGFRCALFLGADEIVYAGSDNWIHPSIFEGDANVGRKIDFVNVETGRLQHACLRDFHGAIPWRIPASLFGDGDVMPDRMQLGSETMLFHGLGRPRWMFRHEEFAPCVDFKSKESRSPYVGVAHSIGDGVEHDAIDSLIGIWPTKQLDDLSEVLHGRVRNAR